MGGSAEMIYTVAFLSQIPATPPPGTESHLKEKWGESGPPQGSEDGRTAPCSFQTDDGPETAFVGEGGGVR